MEAINALPADWVNGINDLSLRNGQDINLNYTGEVDSNPYFITDEKVNIDIDSTPIKNFFKVNALVLDSNTALERKQSKTSGQDTYIVGKASDIVYVARLVTSNIFNVVSSTVFDVPLSVSEIIGKYDIRFTANNLGGRLVCRLFNGTNEYIKPFNISSQTITLDTAISGLDSSYTFELINAYDVLEEGLEQTTGYPVKGYVIKHVKPNEDCYVKFGKYDIPNQEIGSDVVIYYRKINEVQPQFIFQNSIDRYGMFSQEINIDFPITSEQLTQISNELSKLSEPLITFTLDTYRPTYAQRGWKVPVSLANFPYNGNYSVVEKNTQYVYPKGQVINKPFTKQSVKLQSYYYNLDAILASFKRQSQVKSNIALNQIHKTIAKLVYKITSNIKIEISNNKDFVISSNTLYYYRYQNNTNDEKNNLNASLNGSATFTSGIITNDNYSLYYSSPSWLTTANDNSNYDNFTIRRAIYFETGDKASKSLHIFSSKYNTHDYGIVNGAVWYLDFDPSINLISFFVAQNDGKYRLAKCTYNLLENIIYVIQAAFKKVDPSNSNLNTFEICVNGIKQSITFEENVSNISNVLMTNMPIYTNAEVGITGNVYVGKYKDLRNALDLEFRTESQSLIDYNIISS